MFRIGAGEFDMDDDPFAFGINVHVRVRFEAPRCSESGQLREKAVEVGRQLVMPHVRGPFIWDLALAKTHCQPRGMRQDYRSSPSSTRGVEVSPALICH